ncbi:MAG: gliding motility-associated C-terminal domain-containing protein [Saprospiraceae bacterium]
MHNKFINLISLIKNHLSRNRFIFYLCFLISTPSALEAQLPNACGGGSQPAISCADACIFCNFEGYSGSTAGYPSGIVPNFCGTVENVQWLGFIAGDDTATFTIMPFNCSDGNGVQVALYTDCSGEPLACDIGEADGGNIPVSITVDMIPGNNYFLMIDGYAGDLCEFNVSISPTEAVYEPPLGVVSEVTGAVKVCAGASMEYIVQPVPGAGAYIWDGPPGTLVNGEPVPAAAGPTPTLTFGDQSGTVCVQAANSCSVNPPCSASIFVEILPESARPQILGDTSAHLNCLGTPVQLESDVNPPTVYEYTWTTDSAGTIVNGLGSSMPSVSTEGVYSLLVRNSINGCTSTANFTVGPPEQPVASALQIRNVRCYGLSDGGLVIGSPEQGVEPFVYSVDGGPFVQIPEFQFLVAGPHTLTLEDAYGCVWDTVFQVTQPDELLINLPPDTTLHLGQTIRLYSDAQVNYPDRVAQTLIEPIQLSEWLCDTCIYCPINSIRYHVTVIDSAGCPAEDERMLVVENDRRVYIPNAFQPDNFSDGNEHFRVFCGEDVSWINTLQVFDRWGQLVYNRQDFAPNDASVFWDGTVRGEQLPPNVFLYYVQLEFKDGRTEEIRGDVTLVR